MKRYAWLLPFFVAACGGPLTPTRYTDGGAKNPAERGRSYTWNFEGASSLPDSFFVVLGDWKVESGALKQVGAFRSGDYPRIVVRDLTFGDLKLKVNCRPETGRTDRACGLIFRAQDSENYFLVRANALESNVRFYRIVKGDRQTLASADVGVATGRWQTLEIEMKGEELMVVWDGKSVLQARNGTFGPGKIGVWTKADSVTSMDDLEATAL